MLYKVGNRILTRLMPTIGVMLLVLLSVRSFSLVAAVSPRAQTEPTAGEWKTWVLESADQFEVAAPPDDAATQAEIAQLKAMEAQRDDAALLQIAYWNSGPAAYRWNQLAIDKFIAGGAAGNMAFRNLSLMHIAIYDATVAAWNSKAAYNRPRPSEVDDSLTTVIPNPSNPSYPSEYAVTAGAASTVLAWLFPDNAQMYKDKAQEAVNSRLMAGVEYPSDVEAGLKLGEQVAMLVIERGKADGSDAAWTGSVPTEAGMWTGENPIFPTAGTWKTWVLTSSDQFRPPPPPTYDSPELAAEMDEVRSFERTPTSNAIATFWEYGAGGRRIYWFWNDVQSRAILEAGWNDNAPAAARAYVLTNMAAHDASVACWDAKYTYWAMRPFQLDPEFKPLFTTPNHPSYPSAHSCISTAFATVLADLFPVNKENIMGLANQATEARIWGGIHFRSDVEAGIKLGEDVAGAVLSHAG